MKIVVFSTIRDIFLWFLPTNEASVTKISGLISLDANLIKSNALCRNWEEWNLST